MGISNAQRTQSNQALPLTLVCRRPPVGCWTARVNLTGIMAAGAKPKVGQRHVDVEHDMVSCWQGAG